MCFPVSLSLLSHVKYLSLSLSLVFFTGNAVSSSDRYDEATRHDPNEDLFLDTAKDVLDALAPVIDRWPRYAWVAKHLLEPERVSVVIHRVYLLVTTNFTKSLGSLLC